MKATALILACAATPLAAADDCASEMMQHVWSASADMGGGLVSQDVDHQGFLGEDHWAASRVVVTDCTIGYQVSFTRTAKSDPETTVIRRADDVDALLTALPGASLTEIAQQAERGEIEIFAAILGRSECGCALFYPGSEGAGE